MPGARLEGLHCQRQLALGDVLDLPVDGERDVLAALRGAVQQVVRVHHAPASVAHGLELALGPAQPLLHEELDALDALSVHVGEAQHVRGQLAVWVVAPRLLLEPHARDGQRRDALGLLRRDVTLDEGEGAVLAEATRHGRDVQVGDDAGQLLGRGHGVAPRRAQLARVGGDRVHVHAHRQLGAVTVVDGAALGGEPHVARLQPLHVLTDDGGLGDLHRVRAQQHAPREHGEQQPQERDAHLQPATPRLGQVVHRTLPAVARRCASSLSMGMMRAGVGTLISSEPRATVSMRAA